MDSRQTKKMTSKGSDGKQRLIQTIDDIGNERLRKRFVDLTLRLLDELHLKGAGRPDGLLERWQRMRDDLEISLETDALLNLGGSSVYAIEGLKRLMRPWQQDKLAAALKEFASQCDIIGERISGSVLDFGCSTGGDVRLLRDCFGADAWGIDPDRRAITLGRAFGVTKLVWMLSELLFDGGCMMERKVMPFKDSVFHMITSRGTLFESPARGLGGYIADDPRHFNETAFELSRVLKRKGVLFVETMLDPSIATHLLEPHSFAYVRRLRAKGITKDWHVWQKKD